MTAKSSTSAKAPRGPAAAVGSSATAKKATESKMTSTPPNWTAGYEKWVELGNANVEAFMAAGKIATKNMEAFTQEVMETVKARFDEGTEASRAMMACKDAKALVDLQQEQVRSFIESSISDGSKLSELSMKAVSETVAPLADRINANVETLFKPQV
jgi:phasin family protein